MPAPKKVVIKKEPEKKPATVIAKSTHEKAIAEKDAVIEAKKKEVSEAKRETTKEKEKAKKEIDAKAAEINKAHVKAVEANAKAEDWEAKYNSIKDRLGDGIENISDVAEKVNRVTQLKWFGFFLAIALLIAGIYIGFLLHNENKKDRTINTLQVENADLKNKLSLKQQGSTYDSTHVVNNSIPTPDTEGEKKNSSRNNSK